MTSGDSRTLAYKAIPLSSKVFFYAGVFCLWGALILTVSSADFESQSIWDVIKIVVVAGGFAILWAYAATVRKYWYFAVLLPLQFLVNFFCWYGITHYSLANDLPALKRKLLIDGWVEFTLI